VLPSDYGFVAGDSGTHNFDATLKTAGERYIRATDTATASITGLQDNITVNPAATDHLVVANFADPTTAGVQHSFDVTAEDAFGNVTPAYTGTAHFASNDGQAVLPADYTFVAGDSGTHVTASASNAFTAAMAAPSASATTRHPPNFSRCSAARTGPAYSSGDRADSIGCGGQSRHRPVASATSTAMADHRRGGSSAPTSTTTSTSTSRAARRWTASSPMCRAVCGASSTSASARTRRTARR